MRLLKILQILAFLAHELIIIIILGYNCDILFFGKSNPATFFLLEKFPHRRIGVLVAKAWQESYQLTVSRFIKNVPGKSPPPPPTSLHGLQTEQLMCKHITKCGVSDGRKETSQ